MGEKTGPKAKQLVETTIQGIEIGRGETKKVVPPEEVEKLAQIGMKTTEIAKWFGVTEQSLRYNFSDQITKGRLNLNASLRRKQIEVAMSGNPTMLIFLGKNILGQSDSPSESAQNTPLPWSDEVDD